MCRTVSCLDLPESASRGESGNDTSSLLDEAGQALFRLGRVFSRQPMRQHLEHPEHPVELSRILVVQAVERDAEQPDQEMTVGVVAQRLDIDPSTASRLVAETIRAGYLSGTVSPTDARRIRLALTDAGRKLAADARRYQRATFDQITHDWSDGERSEFARLFIKFADSVAQSRANQSIADPRPRH